MNLENTQSDEEYVSVIDASAVLATLQNEPGSEIVDAAAPRSVISSVNLSEVAKKLIETGMPLSEAEALLLSLGLVVIPFDSSLAFLAASIYLDTKSLGSSFADRACLALAIKLKLPVLTTERKWATLKLTVEVQLIR